MFNQRTRFGMFAALGLAAGLASVAVASGPSNSVCANATTLGIGRTTHNNIGASQSVDSECAVAYGVVWFSFVAPETGAYVIDTFGTDNLDSSSGDDADSVIVIYDACGGTQLACNDDFDGLDSSVKISLAAGQTIKIAVGEFDDDEFTFFLNIAPQSFSCREALWNNGDYNGNGAQTSVFGFNDRWEELGLLTFDDFYLCEGRVHRVQTIRGIMCTDAVIPKASLVVVRDCDGLPDRTEGNVVAYATQVASLQQDFEEFNSDCLAGRIELRETGRVNADGFRIIEVIATFDRAWLRGGNYWVTLFGTSGTANPLEQFFFAYAGNEGVVKGRPGVFYDRDSDTFTDVDTLCCGCTDFAFTVEGFYCKILHDNANPLAADDANTTIGFPGTPSLQNGSRTSDKSRSADDIVFAPCRFNQLCYAEAYIWTNCDRIFLELYGNDCKKPGGESFGTIEASCVTDTGRRTWEPGSNIELKLLRAEFYDRWPKLRQSRNGSNLWISVFAQGDNRQNARAYLAFGSRCDRRCDITWNPGHVRGPAYATSLWRSAGADYALMVAIAPEARREVAVVTPPTCRADVNQDGGVTVQDLFDFLSSYFAGCP